MHFQNFRAFPAAAMAASLLLAACGGNNDAPSVDAPKEYGIFGTLSGLDAGSITVTNTDNGDSLTLTANGTFAFSEALADREHYNVAVTSQPLDKVCTVTNGTGAVELDHVRRLAVRCTPRTYTVSGTISGLAGNLRLQNNDADDILRSADGAFTFATPVVASTTYKVAVQDQPAGQTCTVAGGSGTATGGNITGVAVLCVNNTAPRTVGGSVSGLVGSLVLQNNGGNNLTLNADGAFVFTSPLNSGTAYAVTVRTQPFGQSCSVTRGSGTAVNNVTDVSVQCTRANYSVGGQITGLEGVITLFNGSEMIYRSVNGNFVFSTLLPHGTNYNVSIVTQPPGKTCTVQNGSGTVSGANVLDVMVECLPSEYSLGFSVTGLTGTLQVANGSTVNTVSADGNYTFTTTVTHGDNYDVRIATQPDGQTCAVDNPRGVALGNVTNVAVHCGFLVTVVATGPKTLLFTWASRPGATHYRLRKDADGSGTFTPVDGNITTGNAYAETVSVHRQDWLRARYIVDACIGADCISSASVDATQQMINAIGYAKASNPGQDDSFGISVALSADGNLMAVGAPLEDSEATGVNGAQHNDIVGNSGAVYVFARNAIGIWEQEAYIKPSNTDFDDAFGSSLSLSGDGSTLAVASPLDSSPSAGINGDPMPDTLQHAGAIFVFTREPTGWQQEAYIKAGDPGRTDYFGSLYHAVVGAGSGVSLSHDGNRLVVGAPGHVAETPDDPNDSELPNVGAAYVFSRDAGTWQQDQRIIAPNPDSSDLFGFSVAMSGDGETLVIGSPFESSISRGINADGNNNLAVASGAAYVYRLNGAQWDLEAYVKASNATLLDRFGGRVAISHDGNTMAAAAMFEDSLPGSPEERSRPDSGALYVFSRTGSAWAQQALLKAKESVISNQLGYSLALSADGDTLVAGASGDDSASTGVDGNPLDATANGAGAAVVFERTGTSWQQSRYVKAANVDADDTFGASTALSGDGATLAVGAINESGTGTGVGPRQLDNDTPGAGAVYLY